MSEINRQAFIRLLRRANLLPIAERARDLLATATTRRANRRFVLEHSDAPMPPVILMHDPYGVVDYSWYWTTGQATAMHLAEQIHRCLGVPARPIKILEWGCGPARIIRHLSHYEAPGQFELHGTDYNPLMIQWCQRHLPEIEFRVNGLSPPFEYYPDGFFDFAYCISVFTHLSENLHHAWLEELLRVTKPGGYLLLTLHGNHYRSKLLPDEAARYDAGEIVVRNRFTEGGRMFTSFHSERYVRERFLLAGEIVHHNPRPDNPIAAPQDIWIVRKPG